MSTCTLVVVLKSTGNRVYVNLAVGAVRLTVGVVSGVVVVSVGGCVIDFVVVCDSERAPLAPLVPPPPFVPLAESLGGSSRKIRLSSVLSLSTTSSNAVSVRLPVAVLPVAVLPWSSVAV